MIGFSVFRAYSDEEANGANKISHFSISCFFNDLDSILAIGIVWSRSTFVRIDIANSLKKKLTNLYKKLCLG